MTEQPIVVVRGAALREVPPELASFSATVSVRDRDRPTVITRLAEHAAELRSKLDGAGRRETGGVEVYPELRPGSKRVVAYVGRVTTTVTVTDFNGLGELILSIAELDQVAVSGPWWRLKPDSRADAEVRKAAIDDALARAREYAEAVGARIDRLVEIIDEGGGHVGMPARAMFRAEAESPVLKLDPEPQTVEASVTVKVTITEPTLG